MDLLIVSRDELVKMREHKRLSNKDAVICFYDEGGKPVDISGSGASVLTVELDDKDIDEKDFRIHQYFPQSYRAARFIMQSLMKNKRIICQCEYGQSRSAGCAAAIMEYFSGNGLVLFASEKFFPNKAVFSKIYNALRRVRLEMSQEEINSLFPIGRKLNRKEIISDITNKLRAYLANVKKGDNDDDCEYSFFEFITSDGTEHYYMWLFTEELEEFLSKYSEEDIVYAMCGRSAYSSYCYIANFIYDSENGMCYKYCNYYESFEYDKKLRKKYKVVRKEIYD